jgi:hypothetical protein
LRNFERLSANWLKEKDMVETEISERRPVSLRLKREEKKNEERMKVKRRKSVPINRSVLCKIIPQIV